MKALTTGGETITLMEAVDLRDKHMAEFIGYLVELVDSSVANKEERANAKVNMTKRLGALTSACELVGLLEEPEGYLRGLPGGENARIVEV